MVKKGDKPSRWHKMIVEQRTSLGFKGIKIVKQGFKTKKIANP
jgi:hypothetical protein